MKRSLIFSIAVLLAGCFGGYSIKNIDKPLPEYYRLWEKQGETAGESTKRKSSHRCHGAS